MVTAASHAKNDAPHLFSFSAHRQHLLQPEVGWGVETLGWEKWAGFVIILHLQRPGFYIPLVQVKGSWRWGSSVVPKAGLELAPAPVF